MAGKNKVTLTFAGESSDLERTVGKVGRTIRKLDEDSDRSVKNANKSFAMFGDDLDDSKAKRIIGRFGDALAFGTKPVAITVATAFSASFLGQLGSSLIGGIGKLAQGVAAGMALLPAAALAGGLALGTLKVGLSGVGDALKAGLSGDTEAFAESLKGLAPEARMVVTELAGMKGAFDEIKSGVQGNLFGPLVGNVSDLGKIYLPMVGGELMNVAAHMGAAAETAAEFLAFPEIFGAIRDSLSNAGLAVGNLVAGVTGLLAAFIPLIQVGSSFLPGLTDGFSGATERLAAFMQEAERTGKLREFIAAGLQSLRDLWDTAGRLVDLFRILGELGSRIFGGIQLSSGDLITKLTDMATKMRDFLSTAQGSSAVGALMKTLSSIVNNVFGTLQRLAGIIGRTFAPYLPQINDFVGAFFDLKSAVLDVGLDALEPILAGLAAVLLGSVLPAITGLARFLSENTPLLQALGIAIMVTLVPAFTMWAIGAAAAAVATLAAVWPVLLVGAVVTAFAFLVITHWETIKNVTGIVFNAVWGFIKGVFDWVSNNWPLLLAIITGPFGMAVFLISKNWDTIKEKIGQVWDWIKNTVSGVKDWIVARFEDVLGFFKGLPGRVSSIAASLWNGLKDSFRNVLNAIINLWNNLSFTLPTIKIPSVDVPGLGKIGGGSWGGQTFSTPNVPTLHKGGQYAAPPGRKEGLAMLFDGERVVPPGGAGDGTPIIVNVYPAGAVMSERDLFTAIEDGVAAGRLRLPAGARAVAG